MSHLRGENERIVIAILKHGRENPILKVIIFLFVETEMAILKVDGFTSEFCINLLFHTNMLYPIVSPFLLKRTNPQEKTDFELLL